MKFGTENSTYELTDTHLTRFTNHKELRRDGEPIPVVETIDLKVGEPAVFTLDIRGDGILTIRRTTEVKWIEQ